MTNPSFSTIILAAGKGTRMKSDLPKVLHKIASKPLVAHVLSSVSPLAPAQIITVIAPHMEAVEKACTNEFPACQFAIQKEQKGTGDAVQSALTGLTKKTDFILVLYGDTPLMRSETLAMLLDKASQCDIAVLGMQLTDPTGYGRLIADKNMNLDAIVECKDASVEQKKITLCNSGIMAVRSKYLPGLLARLTPNNQSKEYYLTDIISHARTEGLRAMVTVADAKELAGINTRVQLAEAEHALQTRLREKAMLGGATFIDPASVFLASDTTLGQDVIVHPFVVFGEGVKVRDGVEIKPYSHLEGAKVAKNAIIGPYARLRPGTIMDEGSRVGNFVELKKTHLGEGAKVNHLSYVGDAEVGAEANIGAGTITCNYDGVNKFKTVIGEGAFIGSNTALVAPVTIGRGALVAAGSVVTSDVADDSLAIARATQIAKPGRGAKKKSS